MCPVIRFYFVKLSRMDIFGSWGFKEILSRIQLMGWIRASVGKGLGLLVCWNSNCGFQIVYLSGRILEVNIVGCKATVLQIHGTKMSVLEFLNGVGFCAMLKYVLHIINLFLRKSNLGINNMWISPDNLECMFLQLINRNF